MDDAAASERKRQKSKRVETKMDFVPRTDGFANPYVAFFPSGFDPLKKTDDRESGPRAEFASYRNPKPLSRQQELVVQSQGNVDFVGCNYLGEAAGWQPCDYLLGVFDKDKGSLKLMPLAGEKVFRMEPRVRGLDYGRVIDEEATEEEGDAHEMSLAKRRMLTEAFGSQRSRLRAARYDRAQVKEANLGDFKGIERLFQEAAQNDTFLTTEQALQMANATVVRNIPPHDITATIPQTVYLLDKMITPDEWVALAADVKGLKSAALRTGSDQSWPQNKKYPDFVLNRLKRVRIEVRSTALREVRHFGYNYLWDSGHELICVWFPRCGHSTFILHKMSDPLICVMHLMKGDMDGNEKRAHILMYMMHLLAFHSAPPWLIKKAADPWSTSTASDTVNLTESLGIPGPIVAKFLEIFTSKGTGSAKASRGCHRNKEHIELTISYVLVFGLMVDDFQADPYDLALELKMTVSQLRPHYEELGCKFLVHKAAEKLMAGEDLKSGKLKWKVTLPDPLKFPKITSSVQQRVKH